MLEDASSSGRRALETARHTSLTRVNRILQRCSLQWRWHLWNVTVDCLELGYCQHFFETNPFPSIWWNVSIPRTFASCGQQTTPYILINAIAFKSTINVGDLYLLFSSFLLLRLLLFFLFYLFYHYCCFVVFCCCFFSFLFFLIFIYASFYFFLLAFFLFWLNFVFLRPNKAELFPTCSIGT